MVYAFEAFVQKRAPPAGGDDDRRGRDQRFGEATEQAPGGVEEAMHEATLQGLFRGFPDGSR
jgi:hypothetical protein